MHPLRRPGYGADSSVFFHRHFVTLFVCSVARLLRFCGHHLSLHDRIQLRVAHILAQQNQQEKERAQRREKKIHFLFMTLIYSLNSAQCNTSRFFALEKWLFRNSLLSDRIVFALLCVISFHSHFVFHFRKQLANRYNIHFWPGIREKNHSYSPYKEISNNKKIATQINHTNLWTIFS